MFNKYTMIRNIAFATLFAVLYLWIWRPVRQDLSQSFVFPIVGYLKSDLMPIQHQSDGKTTLLLYRTDAEAQKSVFTFTGFGNLFLLIGAVYFLAFGFGWKPVLHLFLIHQLITLLALISLFLAVSWHPAWLYPMNFMVTYFTPAATGMFVLMRRGPSGLRPSG